MSVNDTNVVDDIGTVPDRNLVVLSAAIAGFTSSAASQFVGTGKIAFSSAFEAAAVAAVTAGLTNGISAGLHAAIEGGSFGSALKSGLVSDLAAAGAFAIGDQANPLTLMNIVGHMTPGCVASAVSGSGCGGGAIGGATSAVLSPWRGRTSTKCRDSRGSGK
ncbi:DUF637 domain-containing protein [Burkholderia multivorans]|uniref:DUF637 domain-containing protein n=1 Tax=Burkholderia multivorans TaxID=87883 RepID=UPI001F3CECD1|nr:DUF637 domain-containing protein [Burkholderia multivorans]